MSSLQHDPVERGIQRRKSRIEEKEEKGVEIEIKKEGKAAEKEIQAYTYYNGKLIDNAYAYGDIYSEEAHGGSRQGWEIDCTNRPYLTHIKELSPTWKSLRILADFMEIGTSLTRWREMTGDGSPAVVKNRELERQERASRTKVTRLDYLPTGVESVEFTTSKGLKDALEAEALERDVGEGRFRLFIVEDLSRDVIEHLGAHLDIEPGFFREQIFDCAWYNIRDRWIDPPRLQAFIKKQRWIQLRFPAVRYYKTPESFKNAMKEFGRFNVTRRPEDDINNKSKWDEPKAIVGIARTRASFWLSGRGKAGKAKGTVGVLLVDPTPKEGTPLWYGYRNWEETPPLYGSRQSPSKPPRDSIYNDIVYWAKRTDASHLSELGPAVGLHAPVQALLRLVSAEWLEAAEYIRTRLGQIEWEVSFPEHFLMEDSNINDTLKKLHIWRRIVPLYREMLTETLERVFQFKFQTLALVTTPKAQNTNDLDASDRSLNLEDASCHSSHGDRDSSSETVSMAGGPKKACQSSFPAAHVNKPGPIATMKDDFERILKYMEEYQQRIDRLTSVVTAVISISDSQRSREDNKNVARLTWLATFFIPLGFVASLFSMTEDIGTMRETIKWYFATALPLAVLSLGIAMLFTLTRVQKFFKRSRAKWSVGKK